MSKKSSIVLFNTIIIMACFCVCLYRTFKFRYAIECVYSNQTQTYTGYCVDYERRRTKLKSGVDVSYYFTLDDNMSVYVPEHILEDAGLSEDGVKEVLSQKVSIVYVQGKKPWHTSGRLVSLSSKNREVVSKNSVLNYFAYSADFYLFLVYSLVLALFLLCIMPILSGSCFWRKVKRAYRTIKKKTHKKHVLSIVELPKR